MGCNDYFKVDFSKPRGNLVAGSDIVASVARTAAASESSVLKRSNFLRSRYRNSQNTSVSGTNSSMGTNDHADSSVIIVLPANIEPGTFCIEYCVYDYENNISNTIKACVTIEQLGGGSDGSILYGEKKIPSLTHTDGIR